MLLHTSFKETLGFPHQTRNINGIPASPRHVRHHGHLTNMWHHTLLEDNKSSRNEQCSFLNPVDSLWIPCFIFIWQGFDMNSYTGRYQNLWWRENCIPKLHIQNEPGLWHTCLTRRNVTLLTLPTCIFWFQLIAFLFQPCLPSGWKLLGPSQHVGLPSRLWAPWCPTGPWWNPYLHTLFLEIMPCKILAYTPEI